MSVTIPESQWRQIRNIVTLERNISGEDLARAAITRWLEEYDAKVNQSGPGGTSEHTRALWTRLSGDQSVQLPIERESASNVFVAFDQDQRYYHQMLSEVLHSGIEEYRRAIIANVEGWSRAARDHREMQTLRQSGGNIVPTPVSETEDPAITVERARLAREFAENDRKNDPKPKKRNPGDAATGS